MKGIFHRTCLKLLLAITVLPPVGAAAQESVKFDNFTIDNGLSQSSVNAVVQDKRGFIWIATQDGLNRYDGYSFKIFKKDPRSANSLSNNFIQSLFLDTAGNLWIGTDGGGLNRFDPVHESFKRIPLGPEYRFVYAITQGPDGYIWIGTEKGGITCIHPVTGKSRAFRFRNELGTRFVQSLFTDSKGNVWIGTGDNGLFVYEHEKKQLHSFNASGNEFQPIGSDVIWSIRQDSSSNIWVGTNSGLFRINRVRENYQIHAFRYEPGNRNSISSNTIRAIHPAEGGEIYVGTWGSGMDKMQLQKNGGYKIFHYQNTEFIERSLVDDQVQCIFGDRSGCIWIGMGNGLSKFDPLKQNFDHLDDRPGDPKSLNDRHVWCIYSRNQDVIWVGTGKGLTRVSRDHGRSRYFSHEGRNLNSSYSNSVLSVYEDADGVVWAGCSDGLFRLNEKNGSYIPVPFVRNFDPDGDNRVYRIVEDTSGLLWVASKKGLSIVNKKTGKFSFYEHETGDRNSLSSDIIRTIFIDSRNRHWIASDDGVLARAEIKMDDGLPVITGFKKYTPFSRKGEAEEGMVTSIWEEDGGILWLGTYGGGLIRFNPDRGTFSAYTEADGLSNNAVYGVLGDGKGNLWMSTNRGISRFNTTTEKFRNYQEHDGLQSNEFNIGAYFLAPYGEMFFGGINGLNAFYPNRVKQNETPPEVVISDVMLFNNSIYGDVENGRLSLRYKQNNVSIYFSALHFSNPENNKYKYILEGLDEGMNQVGTMRSAHYYGLPPGSYTFKVFACNSDGIWNTEPAVLHIEIIPPFWATWWFRSFMVVFVLALIWGVWQARMYNIKSHRIRLAMEVRERTREVTLQNQKIEEQKRIIEQEKEKVEQLLLNVLPQDTAEELKTRGKASARSYSRVTVMFTDFKGFTQIAERMRPAELVARLDSYFIQFDQIIQKYGLEKIKTIGDAYMCAGGLPIRNKSNPIDTVIAALEIQKYMRDNSDTFKDMSGGEWDLRIGINTGEVIAGVVGIKRFAYDIWGNTVNVASRMETSCEPGKINVSGSTYAIVEPFFECTYRGKIPAKNKGDIDMYYVHRIKPELSADLDGIVPNEKFKKYVDLYLYSGINYRKAERHIMKVLQEGLPHNLYYHGIHHMYDVIAAVERIALMEGITGEEMFVLKSAATYHDAGFVEQYAKNEPIGARMAREILPIYGYTPEQVDEVERLIYATIIPHNPKSHLEEIICDADLDYLGRDDFHEIADTLRRELKERGIVDTKRNWDEMQVKFLSMHKYFTKSAIALRQAKKEKHIEDIKERLKGKYDDE